MFNFIIGDPKNKTVWFYTKAFFFMLIPGVGLFFTLYLAFLEDRDEDVRIMARGALIIRILAVIVLLVLLAIGMYYILPNIEKFLTNPMQLMRLLR